MVQYFPVITGSLTVSGSIIATGAISMSGSIASSSYATNTSYLNNSGSGEFVPTGSFNAFSSSILTYTGSVNSQLSALQAKTGSYATTGSNIFVGNQTITGSILGSGSLSINGCIVSTGQIVAQTINVQQVTSSVVYSCGSNTFGCDLSNTQTFTGSMFVTGSVARFSDTVCALRFLWSTGSTESFLTTGGGNTAIGNGGTAGLNLYSSNTTRLTIAATGESCFACQVCAPSFIGGTVCGTNANFSGDFYATGNITSNKADSNCVYVGSQIFLSQTYTGIRSGTDHSFNIDTFNCGGGNQKNALKIVQDGTATFSSRVCTSGLSTDASLAMLNSSPISFSGTGGYIYMYARRGGGSCGAIFVNNGTGQNLWFGEAAANIYGFAQNSAATDYSAAPFLNLDVANQRVGIGTSSPNSILTVSGSGAHGIVLGITTNQSDNSGRLFFQNSTTSFVIMNDVDKLTLRYSGIVGNDSGNAALSISCQGVACFACQVCAPSLYISGPGNSSGGSWYSTYTTALCSPNGGRITTRVVEDSLGQWIQVGRFSCVASAEIGNVWSSVTSLSTALCQTAATQFSSDWGASIPTEVRILGATDFCRWRETRTIDFVYRNIPGRPWCVFFNGGNTDGNFLTCCNFGPPRYGFYVCGTYDGFGRWNSPNNTVIGMSDANYTNPSSAYTTPTSNAFNWNVSGDAKLTAKGTNGIYSGQDDSWTTGFGFDDTFQFFNDTYPNITSQGSTGVVFSSAVWILLKFN